MERMHWQDALSLLIGLWLMVALWLLDPAGDPDALERARWTFGLVGLAALFVTLSALFAFEIWNEWLGIALGVVLLGSPWTLGYGEVGVATGQAVFFGGALIVLGLWCAMTARREAGR
jgi:hypothetical protein